MQNQTEKRNNSKSNAESRLCKEPYQECVKSTDRVAVVSTPKEPALSRSEFLALEKEINEAMGIFY